MGSKILCPTLDIMLKKTILALCEVNIKYDLKLEISGSLHVRSDGEKVMTFLIDEEIRSQGQETKPVLNVVKPTMLPTFPSLTGFGTSQSSTGNSTQVLPSIAEVLPSAMKKRLMEHSGVVSSNARNNNLNQNQRIIVSQPVTQNQPGVPQDSPDALEVSSASSHYSKSPIQGSGESLSLGLDFQLLQRPSTESQAIDLSDTSGSEQLHTSDGNNIDSDFAKTALGMQLPTQNVEVNQNRQSQSSDIKQEPPDTPPSTFSHASQLPVATGLQQTAMQQMMLAQMAMQGTMMGMPGVSVNTAHPLTMTGTPVNAKGNKKWQCMFCGILVSSKFYLKSHINAVHTRTRIYPCEMCGKLFYSHGAQRIHKLRNHWVEKRHKCPECGELFVLPFELRQHTKRKHSRPKVEIEAATQPGS